MKKILKWIFSAIAGVMQPILPVLSAAGLLKLVLILMRLTPIFKTYPQTEAIVTDLGNAPFYFLPLLVAWSSAIYFKANPIYDIAAAATLLLPDFIKLMDSNEALKFFFIPVHKTSYAYQVLPIILLGYAESLLEHKLDGIKNKFSAFFKPFIILVCTDLLGFLLIGPVGAIASQGISNAFTWLQNVSPVLAWALFTGSIPLLVMTGTHWIFNVAAIESLGRTGQDVGYMVGFFIENMAIGGAALAVSLLSKEPEKKMNAFSSSMLVLFASISEPCLYGICIPMHYPLITTIAGCVLAGIYQGLHHLLCYIYSFPGLPAVLMFYSPDNPSNLPNVLIAGAIGFAATFILTLLSGKKQAKQKPAESA